MTRLLERCDYQLHRIDAALKEAEQWPAAKRHAMRALIQALQAERAEVLRSHARAASPSRRLAGLASEMNELAA
jgi:hypothetical protein